LLLHPGLSVRLLVTLRIASSDVFLVGLRALFAPLLAAFAIRLCGW
jgi:hypothetical protein